MPHLLSATCQDGPSFGRQSYPVSVCVCVYACDCVHVDSVLSRCLIFCQQPAKMAHLSAGRVIEFVCVHVIVIVYMWTLCCQDASSFVINLPRWPIFRQAELSSICVCVCACVYACDCVHVDSVLSRCLIFCQQPAKMAHLSAGRVIKFVCVHVIVYMWTLCCQDASSFVSNLPRWGIFGSDCVHVNFEYASSLL